MTKRKRTDDYGIEFSGPARTAAGWAIPVPQAFRERLDILSTPRKGGAQWTQGMPPQYTFAGGDVFYDPPDVREMRWGDALAVLRRMVKVEEAKPDVLDGKTVRSGFVVFQLSHYDDGEVSDTERREVTQRGFVAFLRDGVIPEGEEVLKADVPRVGSDEPRRWELVYEDANGDSTTRVVRPRVVVLRQQQVYVSGVCELAQASRDFRADRIRSLIDLSTGEVPDDPTAWIVGQVDLLGDTGSRTGRPRAAADPGKQLKEEIKRGLRVLLALAVADGPLTEPEREILIAYAQVRAAMVGLPNVVDLRSFVTGMVERMRPARDVAQLALRNQSRDYRVWPEHHRVLSQFAHEIAVLGSGTPAEQAILDDLAAAEVVVVDDW